MVDVRLITADATKDWFRAVSAGFLSRPSDEEIEAWLPELPYGRMRGAYSRGSLVSTLASFGLDVSVPGGEVVPAAGITMVTTRPSHRRGGLVRGMLEAEIADAAERGEVVSVLVASEYPIYGRFGFGPATDHVWLDVDARAARMNADAPGEDHTVEELSGADLLAVAPVLFETQRRRFPGGVSRSSWRWGTELGTLARVPQHAPAAFHILCRDGGGEPAGFARFDVRQKWEARVAQSVLQLRELVAVSSAAEACLWRYLLSVDLVGRIQAQDRRVDDDLPWLLQDARTVSQVWRRDMLWLRPLDVCRALQSRRYPVDGTLVMRVRDPGGPAEGAYRLVADGGRASCERSSDDPDLSVTAAGLGALYLGSGRLATLLACGQAVVPDAGAVPRLSALLGWPEPAWCSTWF